MGAAVQTAGRARRDAALPEPAGRARRQHRQRRHRRRRDDAPGAISTAASIPYSLSDWYRYLNCGYLVAAVGGTDKMSPTPPSARSAPTRASPTDEPFTYEAWMDAVGARETFVTYGPLLEFAVDGRPMGQPIAMHRRAAAPWT